MTKPQPIAEIVVKEVDSQYFVGILEITVTSNDARDWVRDNAKEFGSLIEYETDMIPDNFQLRISSLYDPLQVAAFIRSMGSTDDDTDLTAFAPANATGGETTTKEE